MTSKPLTVFSDEEDDFGFTFADDMDIAAPVIAENTEALTQKLQLMYNAILPLLKNLKANPQQEYIKWPDRVKKVDAFKAKLDKIGGENIKTKDI